MSEYVYCVAVTFKMSEYSNESASDFALSHNIPARKLFQMLQKAFENDTVSSVQTKVWHKLFKDH